jgi:hypothetical protein
VHAVDEVGNGSSASVSYTVAYGICLLYDPTQVKKVGSAYPIKLQLCDAAGHNVSSAAIAVRAVDAVAEGNANPGGAFRYDGGSYIFNLKTTGLASGSHTLSFTAAGDPTVHHVQFVLR